MEGAVETMKQQGGKRQRVLKDHTQRGKKFLPPLMAMPFPLTPIDWVRDFVPDLLWIALLIHQHGPNRGLELGLACARATKRHRRTKKTRLYCFASDYEDVRATVAARIRQGLASSGHLYDLQSALFPLTSLYRHSPMSFLFTEQAYENISLPFDDSMGVLKYVTGECIDRHTRLAMITQAAAVVVLLHTDALHVGTDSGLTRLSAILSYPEDDESRMVASGVRATISGIGGPLRDETRKRSKWPPSFWRHGYTISPCELPPPHATAEANEGANEPDIKALLEIARTYQEELSSEIRRCWATCTPDLANPRRQEVLSGLVAREARLVTTLATDPSLWAVDLARILLRCIVETHINLCWLAKKGEPGDFDAFVEYGLGQEKLFYEHLEARIQESGTSVPGGTEHVEQMRARAEGEIRREFLPVNVGDWTAKSTRERALEVGLPDDYNLGYTYHSSVLHGMWNALAQLNLRVCLNPLHRFHRVPALTDPPMVLEPIEQAALTMDESIEVWAAALGVKRQKPNARAGLLDRLTKWLQRASDGQQQRNGNGQSSDRQKGSPVT